MNDDENEPRDYDIVDEFNTDGPTDADLDRCICWCGCRALTTSEVCADCQHGDHIGEDAYYERTDAETGGARVMAKWVWTETDDGYVAEHDGLSTEVLGYDSSDWAWITWRGSRALSDGDDVAFGSADEAKADAEAWYERETEE